MSGMKFALWPLSMNVVSANAASPSGAGSATGRAGADTAGRSSAIAIVPPFSCGARNPRTLRFRPTPSGCDLITPSGLVEGHPDYLREVQRPAARRVGDLLGAAEAVGDYERLRVCSADGREEHALSRLHRDVVVLAGLVAERARQSAAAGIDGLELEAEPGQDGFLVVELH